MTVRLSTMSGRCFAISRMELSAIRENDVKVVEELQLRPGVVQVFVAADPTPELAVAGGFLQVASNVVRIVARRANLAHS